MEVVEHPEETNGHLGGHPGELVLKFVFSVLSDLSAVGDEERPFLEHSCASGDVDAGVEAGLVDGGASHFEEIVDWKAARHLECLFVEVKEKMCEQE